MQRHFTVDQITSLAASGYTVERIASEFGISTGTVEHILDQEWLRWAAQYGYDN